MFTPGTIRRIQVKNFVTYSHAEFYPGPNLNMIIGPNGTGKSTMVAAIILGLGGTPKVVGRGKKVSEYVKYDCPEALIDIFLQGNEENSFLKVSRKFDTQERNAWYINNIKKNLNEVLEAIKVYNIQVNNLCQFLPQDRVQDFAKMNKQDLLKATQLAICREDLVEKQDKLIECRTRYKEISDLMGNKEQRLTEVQEINARLEGKVHSFNKKKKYLISIQHIERKIAWIQYEQLRSNLTEVKEDKTRATEVYETHKKSSKPMENAINKAKKDISDLQKIFSNSSVAIKDTQKALQDRQDKEDNFKQSIQRVRQEMNVKLDEYAERDNEIETLSRKIQELKEAHQNLLDKCGNDQQVLQKVKQITAEIDKVTSTQRNIEDKKEYLVSQKQNRHAELRMMENELGQLENAQHRKLQRLQQINKHAHQAVLWLRNNKNLFKGKVCEPMMLEINVVDPKNAVYLENVISRKDLLAFTCERKEDVNLLVHSLRNQQGLSINVLYSSCDINMNEYQPKIPIERLKQFGMYTYLNTLFTAPDIIMNYLYKTYGIHNIPIGSQKVNQTFEQVPPQIRLFFSDVCRYSVRFSKYTGAKSTRQNQIKSNNTLAISLDIVRMESIKNQIQDIKTHFSNADNEIKNYENQLGQLTTKTQDLHSQLKVVRDLKRQIQMIGSRHEAMQKKVETLKAANTNRDTIKSKADQQIKKIAKEMQSNQKEIFNKFKSYKQIVIKSKLNAEKIELARKRAAYLENQFNETHRQIQEAEEMLNKVKERYANILGQAKAALQKAKHLSNGFTPVDEGFEEFKEMYEKLQDNIQGLQSEREELLSKINCLKVADNGEMEEYEERLQTIKNIEEELDQANTELSKTKAQMDKLEDDWLVPLEALVTEINVRFSNAFKRMKCAGEVAIWIGENREDYSQYGLSIKVSYRNGEPLQDLNSTIQSGGERAVATAAFMLSLQELTPVPFRCVDEINQGMDANNERRIFDLLIDCTTQANTAQYFLITPKLVPHLKYSDNIMIHIVHNGPFVGTDRKWFLSKLCNPQEVQVNI